MKTLIPSRSPIAVRLLVAATGTGAALTGAGALAATPDIHVDAVVVIAGQDVGTYHEETVTRSQQVEDTVLQDIFLNRLGARLEMRTREVSIQDARGALTSEHIESSTSSTTVVTDVGVQGHALIVTTRAGGKSYPRSLPFTGKLLGPAGMRRLVAGATHAVRYQAYVAELGRIAAITLTPAGHEQLTFDGRSLETLKLDYRIAGYPTASTLWVDTSGYTVRAVQDTPMGAVEIRRGAAPAKVSAAQLPAESYERTIALSNIRLPHPRQLKSVTVEISARDPAGIAWPDLASRTQRVIEQTPRHLVLEISRARIGAYRDAGSTPSSAYLEPNVLLQSDDAAVQQIARTVAPGERDPWQVAQALPRWVNENMHFDAGIAIAPASEVARDRHGTCLGYSILLASLARARHIPSRLKIGYVYDSRIWGGHAWVEVLIDGQWRGLDAAEYSPGIADAARIAVVTATGQSGTVEGVGELAKLYAKVDIRTRGYRLGNQTVQVAPSAADHGVSGNTYENPWLGLRVIKPQSASFEQLDSHWPQGVSVVTVRSGGGPLRSATPALTQTRRPPRW